MHTLHMYTHVQAHTTHACPSAHTQRQAHTLSYTHKHTHMAQILNHDRNLTMKVGCRLGWETWSHHFQGFVSEMSHMQVQLCSATWTPPPEKPAQPQRPQLSSVSTLPKGVSSGCLLSKCHLWFFSKKKNRKNFCFYICYF